MLALVVNPVATSVSPAVLARVVPVLERRWSVEVLRTQAPGHASELAAGAARDGASVVAVYGGDGTAAEVVRGLMGVSPGPLFAALPGGSASVLARLLGMGGDAVRAAGWLASGAATARRMDVASANGVPFTFSAGIGVDAAAVELVDQDAARKARLGWRAFLAEALRLAGDDYIGAQAMLTIRSGGREVRGITAIVQNAEAYTFAGVRPLTISTRVSLESGSIAPTALLPGVRWADVPAIAARLLSPAPADGHPRLEVLDPADEVVVACDRPLPLHLDGDFQDRVREVRFTVARGVLPVLRRPARRGGALLDAPGAAWSGVSRLGRRRRRGRGGASAAGGGADDAAVDERAGASASAAAAPRAGSSS